VHFAQFWPNCFKQIWQNDYVSKKSSLILPPLNSLHSQPNSIAFNPPASPVRLPSKTRKPPKSETEGTFPKTADWPASFYE